MEDARFRKFWAKENLPDLKLKQVTREAILKYLAGHEETLVLVAETIDDGLQTAARKGTNPKEEMLAALKAAKLKIRSKASHDTVSKVTQRPVDEIVDEASALQYDALNRLDANDAENASKRLARARRLLAACLKREPANVGALAAMGYVEKTQAQVFQVVADEARAARLLGRAAIYFAKAYENDPTDVSTLNGIANIFLFAHDYDRAIELGKMILKSEPSYAAAAFDLSIALEGKLKEVGHDQRIEGDLAALYMYLEQLTPHSPQIFPAHYLAYFQRRRRELLA